MRGCKIYRFAAALKDLSRDWGHWSVITEETNLQIRVFFLNVKPAYICCSTGLLQRFQLLQYLCTKLLNFIWWSQNKSALHWTQYLLSNISETFSKCCNIFLLYYYSDMEQSSCLPKCQTKMIWKRFISAKQLQKHCRNCKM